VTVHLAELENLIRSIQLQPDHMQNISVTMYAPMQRLTKLKAFLDSFVNTFEQNRQQDESTAMHESTISHIGALHNGTAAIAIAVNHLIPSAEPAQSNQEVPLVTIGVEQFISKLALFCPEISGPEYELDLGNLERTIDTIDPHDLYDLKHALMGFLHSLRADVEMQNSRFHKDSEIASSTAIQLCRHTEHLLNILLRKGPYDSESALLKKLDAIQQFTDKCESTQGFARFAKYVEAILFAAAAFVANIAIVTGLCAIAGTLFGGPAGTVLGAVTGLLQGTYSAIGAAIVAFSAALAVPETIYAAKHFHFKHNPLTEKALEIADMATFVMVHEKRLI
jgi:hypothetical protein